MGLIKKFKRPVIGFWSGDQNNFQFLDPLISKLNQEFKTRKFDYEGDVKQLAKQLNLVDLAWFEWGNGPIVPASHMDIRPPIINRVHRYELYSETLSHINWNKVEKSVFSSPSMIYKFKQKYPDEYKLAKPEFIPIGVDTSLFKFKRKKITKKLIYVGRIHPHKNPSLLLQIFAKLLSRDSEYKLTVIGRFHDELYEEYFKDQIGKLDLTDNIEIIGEIEQSELVKHYQQSDFILITSIIEGLSQASLEAMACGVRPVIFNYYGCEKGYPKKYIYNTVDEAIKMITNPVAPRIESRRFIEKNHNLEDITARVRRRFKELVGD